MSKQNRKKNNYGQNRCRRCDRPLSNPNDIYGWRCAEIMGDINLENEDVLDDGELFLHNEYLNMDSLREKLESIKQSDSFTVYGENYKNMFIKEKTDEPEDIKYNVITDMYVHGKRYQVEYKNDNGVIRFPFEYNSDYRLILLSGAGKALSKAIYEGAKVLNPENLSGRTLNGINTELQLHYAAYKGGVLKERAETADVGGIMPKKAGYDSNAWLFEGIDLAEDIINPKAKDVVDMVKKIWRYYDK